jgi:hypothetical protein
MRRRGSAPAAPPALRARTRSTGLSPGRAAVRRPRAVPHTSAAAAAQAPGWGARSACAFEGREGPGRLRRSVDDQGGEKCRPRVGGHAGRAGRVQCPLHGREPARRDQPDAACAQHGVQHGGFSGPLAKGAVRSVSVEMMLELVENCFRVSLVEDQDSVEEFAPDGADEAFGDGVGPRRPYGRLDDRDVEGGEDGVEGGGELGSRSWMRNRNRWPASSRSMVRLRACWVS